MFPSLLRIKRKEEEVQSGGMRKEGEKFVRFHIEFEIQILGIRGFGKTRDNYLT